MNEKRKCAFYGGETGMDADADRISEHDRMEKRSKMCVWPRRNGQLQIFREGPKRKLNEINEENGRPETKKNARNLDQRKSKSNQSM